MLWKKLSIAIFCCWSVCAWAADPWCNSTGTPAFKFEWLPKNEAEPSNGSVHILDASGKIIQELDDLENHSGSSESLNTSRDFNNDGCADLLVTSDIAGIGNESIKVFLYNPKTRRFEVSEALSGIGGLDLDRNDKNCVTGFWKGGATDISTARYCWSKGKLVIKSEYSVSPVYNEEGGLRCYRHIMTDYRGGKKRKRTECTKQF